MVSLWISLIAFGCRSAFSGGGAVFVKKSTPQFGSKKSGGGASVREIAAWLPPGPATFRQPEGMALAGLSAHRRPCGRRTAIFVAGPLHSGAWCPKNRSWAEVAELADAQVQDLVPVKGVQVQVLSSALSKPLQHNQLRGLLCFLRRETIGEKTSGKQFLA